MNVHMHYRTCKALDCILWCSLLCRYLFPPGRNVFAKPTERWAAYIDPSTGYGLGVFVPTAWTGITAYRTGYDGSDRPYDCTYFAHTIRMALTPGIRPYRYQVFITVGRLNEIRETFVKLAADPTIMRPEMIRDIAQYLKSSVDLASGQPDIGRVLLDGRMMSYGPATAAPPTGTASQPRPGASPMQGVSGLEAEARRKAAGDASVVVEEVDDTDQGSVDGGSQQGSKGNMMQLLTAVLAAAAGVALLGVGAAVVVQRRRRAAAARAESYQGVTAVVGTDTGGSSKGTDAGGASRVTAEAALEAEDSEGPGGPRAAAAVS